MSNAFQLNDLGRHDPKTSLAYTASRAQVAANDDNDFLRMEDISGKWPAWKSTSFILLTCGTFWAAAGWTVLRLIG